MHLFQVVKYVMGYRCDAFLLLDVNIEVYGETNLLRPFGSSPKTTAAVSTCPARSAYFSVLLEASTGKTLDVLQSSAGVKCISKLLASLKK